MSDAVERVARALINPVAQAWEHRTEANRDGLREAARAAITALRQCTPAMLEAGCHAHPEGGYHTGTSLLEIIESEWVAMIDAALAG